MIKDSRVIDLSVFTGREKEVLQELSQGLANKDIARNLHISAHTVRDHISAMLQKTQTRNRVELVFFALALRM